MTHTPGPWNNRRQLIVGPDVTGAYPYIYIACTEEDDIEDRVAPAAERLSNARLIAAAPELLDMCERLLGFAVNYGAPSAVEAGHGMLEAARELLAKAKGTAQ
jgi:hypothetical protein